MGVAGWIIAAVGAWAAIHNNGQPTRFAGGASWMPPATRRFHAVTVVVFDACLIAGSIVL